MRCTVHVRHYRSGEHPILENRIPSPSVKKSRWEWTAIVYGTVPQISANMHHVSETLQNRAYLECTGFYIQKGIARHRNLEGMSTMTVLIFEDINFKHMSKITSERRGISVEVIRQYDRFALNRWPRRRGTPWHKKTARRDWEEICFSSERGQGRVVLVGQDEHADIMLTVDCVLPSVLPSHRFTCTYSPPSVCSTRKLTARCIKSSRRAFMKFPCCLVTVC